MKKAVIIGAGLGGLASAIELAGRGWEVRVIEAAAEAGGKAGIAVVDGVEFDTGPSLLTLPEVLDGVLRAGGSSLGDELDLLPLNPAFRYIWPGGPTLDMYADPAETLASVRDALGMAAEAEFADFLAYSRRIWEAAASRFVYAEAPTVFGVLRMGMTGLAAVSKIDGVRTMEAAIRSRVRTPALRDVLARYATYNGSDARRAPATLNCIAHVELGLGGWGVRGGMYSVVRALERVARRGGVEFEYGRRVERVDVKGGHAVAVDGEPADVVVVNADVGAVTAGLLRVEPRPSLNVEPRSMSGWNAVVRARRAMRVGHTVLFPERPYLEEFADVFDRRRWPADPTVYVCAQERCHARGGWPEDEPLFLMVNAPAGAEVDGVEAVAMRRLVGAGLIAIEDAVVWRRTPRDLAERFPGSEGALYGAASNSMFSAFTRPANRGTVRGLYYASGSAHPGGGVPLCLQSGRQAAADILADFA
ncbi:phytoene desaturase [Deltaproteobacteria bacterium]|nr:phytoene desaturase [Deltaproteobacteria bacterium]